MVCTPGMWHQDKNLKSKMRIFRMISGPLFEQDWSLASAVSVKTVGSVVLGARTDAESRFRHKQRMTPGSHLSYQLLLRLQSTTDVFG